MTINITLRKLLDSSGPLGSISNLPLKGKTAFRFAKIINLVNIELEALDKARENLIEQYVADRESRPVKFVGGNKAERTESEALFNKEMTELMETEVGLNTERVNPELLDNIEGIKPIWLSTLDWLFESE